MEFDLPLAAVVEAGTVQTTKVTVAARIYQVVQIAAALLDFTNAQQCSGADEHVI